jgi:hypothetical protein
VELVLVPFLYSPVLITLQTVLKATYVKREYHERPPVVRPFPFGRNSSFAASLNLLCRATSCNNSKIVKDEEEVSVLHLTVARILGVEDNLVLVHFLVQSSKFPPFPAPPPVCV